MTAEQYKQQEEFPLKDEYADRAVPLDARMHWIKPSMVWLGFSTQFISFFVGAEVAMKVGITWAVLGIFIGCVFLVVESGLIAWASAKYGYSFPMMNKKAWGNKAFLIPSLFLAVLVTGWYAYQAMATGDVWEKAWGVNAHWASFIFAILFALTATKYKWMVWARFLGVPALFVMCAYLFYYNIIPNWGKAWSFTVANPDYSYGITTGISFFIISSIMTGDIVRYAKPKPFDSTMVTIFAFIVGNGLALSVGALAYAAYPNLETWWGLVNIQLGIPVVLAATWMNWVSGDACLYNAVMGYTNAHPKVKWKQAIIIGGIIGAIAAGTAGLKTVVPFMLAIGTLVPPIGGVIIADFYWLRKGDYSFDRKDNWNWIALISVVIGILIAWISMKTIPGLPNQIPGMLASFLAFGILMNATGKATEMVKP
jgi:cytosine permease